MSSGEAGPQDYVSRKHFIEHLARVIRLPENRVEIDEGVANVEIGSDPGFDRLGVHGLVGLRRGLAGAGGGGGLRVGLDEDVKEERGCWRLCR